MVRLAAAAAHFTRDVGFDLDRIKMIVAHARDAGVALLALPGGALGGYLTDLRHPDEECLPPLLEPNGAEVRSVIDIAGEMVVCLGYSEPGPGALRYDAAVCLSGDGVLGRHRKVHIPAGVGRCSRRATGSPRSTPRSGGWACSSTTTRRSRRQRGRSRSTEPRSSRASPRGRRR